MPCAAYCAPADDRHGIAIDSDQAERGMAGIEYAIIDLGLHGPEAAAAGDHGVALSGNMSRSRRWSVCFEFQWWICF